MNKKPAEYTKVNQNLIHLTKPVYELLEDYQNLPDSITGNLSFNKDPDYYTVVDFTRVFEKCVGGEISTDELNVWIDRFANDGTLKPVVEHKKLLYSIVFAFEDLDRTGEPITPEFVASCLDKLKNAQPEDVGKSEDLGL